MPPFDLVTALFFGCFVFGVGFTIVAYFLGSLDLAGHDVGHVGHAPVDAALPHAGAAGLPTDGGHGVVATGKLTAPTGGPSPFNLQVIAAFITFFGGVGFALSLLGVVGGLIVVPLALLGGLVGGGIVFWFLAKVLYRAQTPLMRDADYDVTGAIARVTSGIRAGGVGEIVFERQGRQRVEGARDVQGRAIPAGVEVVILRYERGIAYVEPRDEFFGVDWPNALPGR
ncbi:MAG: hypothetical protein NZ518_01215 [Dehalococcoidia bacterium]|nr:hypothetical protein [Dehalococcoidia bacterium]